MELNYSLPRASFSEAYQSVVTARIEKIRPVIKDVLPNVLIDLILDYVPPTELEFARLSNPPFFYSHMIIPGDEFKNYSKMIIVPTNELKDIYSMIKKLYTLHPYEAFNRIEVHEVWTISYEESFYAAAAQATADLRDLDIHPNLQDYLDHQ